MKGKGHLPEIAIHLLLVLVLPLAMISIADAVISWLGLHFLWQDAIVLFAKAGVMVNTAIHPVPEKYNKGSGESIRLFPEFSYSSRPTLFGKKRTVSKDKNVHDEGEALPEAANNGTQAVVSSNADSKSE